jgi:hypothetical protein
MAERRIGEIRADLHDHIAHERAQGIGDRRIVYGIVSRMARGLKADVSWRRVARPSKGHRMTPSLAILATVLGVAAGLAAIAYGEVGDFPELMLLGVLFVVLAVTMGVRSRLRRR